MFQFEKYLKSPYQLLRSLHSHHMGPSFDLLADGWFWLQLSSEGGENVARSQRNPSHLVIIELTERKL